MNERVALLLPTLAVGGAEVVAVKIANELVGRGYRVDVVLSRTDGRLGEELAADVRVVDVGATVAGRPLRYPWPELYVLGNVRSYLARVQPDVVLSSLALTNVIAAVAARLVTPSPRLVLSEHAPPSRQRGVKYRLSRAAARQTYDWADCVIAVSRGVRTEVGELAGLDDDRMAVIYNPVVDEALLRARSEPVEHPWFGGDVPVILSVGSLRPVKGHETLIRAFEALLADRDARLVLIGEGSYRTTLRELVEDRGLTEKVAFLGEQPNPYKYMASASVFVLASRFEGLGNVLIESLACGCPVVSTACPYGPAEILENGEYGRLVPVDDPVAMAAAIEATLDDPPDESLLRRRADDFRVATIVDEYEAVLFP